MQQRYDHRLRDLVHSTGDIGHATRRGVPRSTARGWLTSPRAKVVTVDVVDLDVLRLQQEVLALRQRAEWLIAMLRLVVVLLKASGFSLAGVRLSRIMSSWLMLPYIGNNSFALVTGLLQSLV